VRHRSAKQVLYVLNRAGGGVIRLIFVTIIGKENA